MALAWLRVEPHALLIRPLPPSSRVPFFLRPPSPPPASSHCSLLLIPVSAWVCARWALSKQILSPPLVLSTAVEAAEVLARGSFYFNVWIDRGAVLYEDFRGKVFPPEWAVRTFWSVTGSKKHRVSGCESLEQSASFVCLKSVQVISGWNSRHLPRWWSKGRNPTWCGFLFCIVLCCSSLLWLYESCKLLKIARFFILEKNN